MKNKPEQASSKAFKRSRTPRSSSLNDSGEKLSHMYWLKADLPIQKKGICTHISDFFANLFPSQTKKGTKILNTYPKSSSKQMTSQILKTNRTRTPIHKHNREHKSLVMPARLKILILDAVIHALPAAALIYGMPVIKRYIPVWTGHFFQLDHVKKMTALLQHQTEIYQSLVSMSSPISFGNYLSALMASTMASAKTSMLETTTSICSSLAGGLLTLLEILCLIWLFFNFIRFYKNRMTRHKITANIVSEIKPALLDISHRLERLEKSKNGLNKRRSSD